MSRLPTPLGQAHDVGRNRARGELRADFRRVGARTEPDHVYETGGYRLRMPHSHGPHCNAVMVNTGGGMAGGDEVRFDFSAGEATALTITSTAAEKIYRTEESPTRVAVSLAAAAGARLEWLPQETILFDGAHLDRRLDADLAPDATLLIGEMLVFGRLAMGETLRAGRIGDRWRIRRGGRLVAAEDLALGGNIAALLDRAALGGGARASATLLLVSPQAEIGLAGVRDILARIDGAGGLVAGASAWDGRLVVRALCPSPALLRAAIVSLLERLRGGSLARLWT